LGKFLVGVSLVVASFRVAASAQEVVLRCDPAQSSANFTLGDALHTVKGSFQLKSGELHFDPATEKVSGEVVFDATSGKSGNDSRDRKMHKDVLESASYPEIAFRPDQVQGAVAANGRSNAQVHGMFRIHGAEHEMTAPAEVTPGAERWHLTSHFPIPYTKWGMKNPSLLFLRVGNSVDLVIHGACSVAAAAR